MSPIGRLLVRFGAYYRFQETFAYALWRGLRYGEPVLRRRNERRFYRRLFGSSLTDAVVFDVGARRGLRSLTLMELGARVVAIDPDPYNQSVLARRLVASRKRPHPATLLAVAVSDREGEALLRVHAPGSGLNSLSEKWVHALAQDCTRFGESQAFPGQISVKTTTLAALVAVHGAPAYIKIDVEGHELAVLRGLDLAVPFVSFEVNLPEFLDEGLACVDRLEALSPGCEFNLYRDGDASFVLQTWVDANAVKELVRASPDRSVELFFRRS